jgi:hypothetical protein
VGFLDWLFGRRAAPSPSTPAADRAPRSVQPSGEVAAAIDRLARRAWQHSESLSTRNFVLLPGGMPADLSGMVRSMLDHARRVAPGLLVPMHVPRVIVRDHPDAAGQFVVDGDGWVTITIRPSFVRDVKAARAILAHETSHYVLENNGIRERDRDANERLTDLAVFVLGLGGLYLEGYRTLPSSSRPGHRLGYLSDAEVRLAYQHTFDLRVPGTLSLPTQTDLTCQELARAITDASTRARLLSHLRSRHPGLSEGELCALAIEEYRRDNR